MINVNTCGISTSLILCKINTLAAQVAALQNCCANNPDYYTRTLSGFAVFIAQSVHKLPIITSVIVKNALGQVVEVDVVINADQSVQINSNIILTNHILILS